MEADAIVHDVHILVDSQPQSWRRAADEMQLVLLLLRRTLDSRERLELTYALLFATRPLRPPLTIQSQHGSHAL